MATLTWTNNILTIRSPAINITFQLLEWYADDIDVGIGKFLSGLYETDFVESNDHINGLTLQLVGTNLHIGIYSLKIIVPDVVGYEDLFRQIHQDTYHP